MIKVSNSKKIAAKGDRLNWTPIKEVKPVKLAAWMIEGRVLSAHDLDAKQTGAFKIVP